MAHEYPDCFDSWEDYCEFVNFHHNVLSVEIIEPLVLHCIFDDGKETIFDLHWVLDGSYKDSPIILTKVGEALRNDPTLSTMEITQGGLMFAGCRYGLSSEDLYHKGKEIKAPTKPPLS